MIYDEPREGAVLTDGDRIVRFVGERPDRRDYYIMRVLYPSCYTDTELKGWFHATFREADLRLLDRLELV